MQTAGCKGFRRLQKLLDLGLLYRVLEAIMSRVIGFRVTGVRVIGVRVFGVRVLGF